MKQKRRASKTEPALATTGERVAFARKYRHWSQTDLANETGVVQQTIQAIEANKIKKSRHLYDIGHVTGFSYEWLIKGKGPPRADVSTTQSLSPLMLPLLPLEQCADAGQREAAKGIDAARVTVDPQMAGEISAGAFVIRVPENDHGMTPTIAAGDWLVIDPCAPLRPGDVVVCWVKSIGAAVIRRYRANSISSSATYPFELTADNNDYSPFVVENEKSGKLVGRMVGGYWRRSR